MVAARNRELAVVVQTVGKNIGNTRKQMLAYVEGVKSMGITTQAANQAVIQMAQAQIDLSYATDLARLAQDAAVIGQLDSSQAFQKMITGIQRGSLVMLRQIGIQADFAGAYARTAKELGISSTALTQQQKIQARVNEVMKNANQIAGTYEAAMGEAGKQMRSMSRHVEELADELGQEMLPTFSKGIQTGTAFLKWLRALDPAIKATAVDMAAAAAAIGTVGGSAALAIPKIMGMVRALAALRAVQALGGLGVVGLGAAALTAAATAVIYLKEKEEAHREEAAAILDSTENYRQYLYELEQADLASYALSESLWGVAKAAEAAGRGFDLVALQNAREDMELGFEALNKWIEAGPKIGEAVEDMGGKVGVLADRFGELIPEMSDLQLLIVADKTEMLNLTSAMELESSEASRLAAMIVELAKAEQLRRAHIEAMTELEMRRVALWREQGKEGDDLTQQLREQTAQMSGWESAVEDAHAATLEYEGEIPTLAKLQKEYLKSLSLTAEEYANLKEETGLTKDQLIYLHREFGLGEQEILDWAQAVRDASQAALDMRLSALDALARGLVGLRDLEDEAAESAENYEKSLDDLKAELAGVSGTVKFDFEATLPDATSVKERLDMMGDAWDEWGLRFQDIIEHGVESPWYAAIQAMGYEKPPDAGVREWAEDMKRAFYEGDLQELINKDSYAWRANAEEVGAAQAEATAKHAEEVGKRKAAIQEEIDALEAARQVQLEAEQAARERALVELALNLADQTGMLDAWAQTAFKFPGIDTSDLDVSADQVLTLLDAGVIELDSKLATLVNNYVSGLGTIEEETAGIAEANEQALSDIASGQWAQDIEDALSEAMEITKHLPEEEIAAIGEELGGVGEAVPVDPFEDWLEQIEGVEEAVVDMDAAAVTALQNIGTASTDTTSAMDDQWLVNLIPGIETKSEGMGKKWGKVASGMSKDFGETAKDVKSDIGDIKRELDSIPKQIDIEVNVNYNDAGAPGGTGGGDTGGGGGEEPPALPPGPGGVQPAGATIYAWWNTAQAASAATNAGQRLGDRIAEAIVNRTRKKWKLPFKMLEAAGELSTIGGHFADLYQEQVLDPIQERMDELNQTIEEAEDILTDRDLLSQMSGEQYAQFMNQYNDALRERNGLEAEYNEQQKRALEYQRAAADLEMLQRQLDLLMLLYDFDLDPAYILEGLELGLDVSMEDMIEAMTRAMDALVTQAESKLKERLGISSPSKLMLEIGAQMKAGLLQGWYQPPERVMAGTPAPQLPAPSGPTINLGMDTVINSGLDYEIFKADVRRIVRDEIRY
jgi:hypothetical protein